MKTSESNTPQGNLRSDGPVESASRGDASPNFSSPPVTLADDPFKGCSVPSRSIELNDSFSSPLEDRPSPGFNDSFSSPLEDRDDPFKGCSVPSRSIELNDSFSSPLEDRPSPGFNDSFSSPLEDRPSPGLRDNFSSPPDPITQLRETVEYLRWSGLGSAEEIKVAEEELRKATEQDERDRGYSRFRVTTDLDAGPCGDVVKG